MKVVAPTGAARRRWGLAFAIQKRLYNSASPAGPCGRLRRAFGTFPPLRFGAFRRGANAIVIPKQGRIMRCTPASAPFGSPSARGYPRRGGVGSCFAFPNGGSWDFHPRPAERVALSVPPSCLDCPCARRSGRLLRCVRLHPRSYGNNCQWPIALRFCHPLLTVSVHRCLSASVIRFKRSQ